MGDEANEREAGEVRVRAGAMLRAARHLPRLWSLVPGEARRAVFLWLGLLVVQGVLPVATVYLSCDLVNGIVAGVGRGARHLLARGILVPAALLGAVLLVDEVLQRAEGWLKEYQSERIRDHIASLIHARSAAVDLAFYETPEYYDHLHRARSEAWYRPAELVSTAGALVRSGITLVAMGAVLFRFGPLVPALLLLSTLPALVVVVRNALRQHAFALRTTADERRSWYYDEELTSSRAAAELRLFDLGAHFAGRYQEVRRRLREARLELLRGQAAGEILAALAALAAAGGCLVWMGARTLAGALTLGELTQFLIAFRSGQQMLHGLLGQIGEIYRNVLFLGNLFEFLDLRNAIEDPAKPAPPPEPIRSGIDIEDVTFAYPGGPGPVLEGFSLRLPAGRIAAIVGRNGTGKSTLLRLLCRLSDPAAGRIAIDGVDLRAMRVEDIRRLVAVLFQVPVQYSETAARNIELGDLSRSGDRAAIIEAARAAGADAAIERLAAGYDTPLGKWFGDGAELSVGEWQRIALARAFLRRAPIVLLDEPTSAMDSWAEAEWMGKLRSAAAGRTVLIVTHRFTTAMQADVIHVMDGGRIAESGTHDELLALSGRYAASWTAQVKEQKLRA